MFHPLRKPAPLLLALTAGLATAAPDWEAVSPGSAGVHASISAFARKDSVFYVAGYFSDIEGVPAHNIAKWDGKKWQAMGTGVDGGVQSICTGPGDIVAVSGSFEMAGDKIARNVAVWNGKEWSGVGDGLANGAKSILGLPAVACGDDSSVYVGGMVGNIGNANIDYFARYKNGEWSAPGGGLDRTVHSLGKGPDGRIYAGGSFSHAGDSLAYRLAIWNGQKWSTMGSGIYAQSASVKAFAFGPEGKVCITGEFAAVGGVSASNVACWNGSKWSALGTGLDGEGLSAIFDSKGRLVVAGKFRQAGGIPAGDVARWDGLKWESLQPVVDTARPYINIYQVAEDPSGRLWLGFSGGHPGFAGNASGVAILEDGNWRPLKDGMNGGARFLFAEPSGDLVVAGGFLRIGNIATGGMARYHDGVWTSMLDTIAGSFDDLKRTPDGRFLAIGSFKRIDGTAIDRTAEWAAGKWRAWGPGTKGSFHQIETTIDGDVALSGYFDTLDGAAIKNFAIRGPTSPTWQGAPSLGGQQVRDFCSVAPGRWALTTTESFSPLYILDSNGRTLVSSQNESPNVFFSDGNGTLAYVKSGGWLAVVRPEGRDSFPLPAGTTPVAYIFDADRNPILSFEHTSPSGTWATVQRHTRGAWQMLGSKLDKVPGRLALDTAHDILYAAGSFGMVGGETHYLAKIPLARSVPVARKTISVNGWFAGQGRNLSCARSGTLRVYRPDGGLELATEVAAGARMTDFVTTPGLHFLRLGTETRTLTTTSRGFQP